MNRVFLDGMLGFTGGVMVAASFWSLLAPGIEMSEGEGFVKSNSSSCWIRSWSFIYFWFRQNLTTSSYKF